MTERLDEIEFEFCAAWETDNPLTLQAIIEQHPELTAAERDELVDFVLEFVSLENFLARHPSTETPGDPALIERVLSHFWSNYSTKSGSGT